MNDRYIILKIEIVINKILYAKNVINKEKYNQVAKKLDKLLFDECKAKH